MPVPRRRRFHDPRAGGCARRIALGALAASLAAAAPARAEAPFRFGAYRATITDLTDPADVVIASDGTILIAESGADRIRRFAPDGTDLGAIGGSGVAPGQFVRPSGIAVDDAGHLFVADTGNQRVQILAPDGRFLQGWGGRGSKPGLFNDPTGIALAGSRIYVADVGNDRVQVFDVEGRRLMTIGTGGDGDGAFHHPLDVAVDAEGNVVVVDTDNDRLQAFDPEGVFVRTWGDWGPFVGLLDQPSAVVCRDGLRYVADTRNHRIQVFDRAGELVEQWGTHALLPHEGEGRLHYPNALAIAPSGAFAVVCEGFENRCQIFDALPAGAPPPAAPVPPSKSKAHFGERIDIDGRLLTMAEPENHRVYLFDLTRDIPVVIGDFGDRGRGYGQFLRIEALDLDVARRRLRVGDAALRRLMEFSLNYEPDEPRGYALHRARLARSYDLDWIRANAGDVDLEWPIEPAAVERASDGTLFVLDPRNAKVLVFDASMSLVRAWGGFGTQPGRLRRPTDLALAADGRRVLVADADNRRIQMFDAEGRPLGAWDGAGGRDFVRPFGIATAPDGFVYVTDDVSHRVSKFTTAGTLVTSWGGLGVEHGRFWKPKGIALDERGRIYVVDYGNHRGQVFDADGTWLVTFGTGRAYTKWDTPRGEGDRP